MATKEIRAGLLSKVARFVRNPTKDWSELDKPEPDTEQENGYSKLALKEMIERKRQNDFVRRREFDYLRKLRRNAPVVSLDLTGRPTFFQSSIASNPDERASTIKKIDDIEAQMSKQWWKGKQEDVSVPEGNLPVATIPSRVRDTTRANFAPTQASVLNLDCGPGQGADSETTQMGLSLPDDRGATDDSESMTVSGQAGRGRIDAGASEFSPSKLFSVELGDSLADSDLEEAAIRFANGDDEGAEVGLLAALQADRVPPESADRWASALFDLYRATGQQVSFDRIALDYAQRFGRSAPAWFSTPDLLGHIAPSLPVALVKASGRSRHDVWECPAALDLQGLQALLASLSRASEPWRLDWSRLVTISSDAAESLANLFAEWCAKPLKLHFIGADVLERTLRSLTPSDDKQVDPVWWRLRLDALRILRLHDEFELAALDYCVIYEVSPPPWADARCDYVNEGLAPIAALESATGLGRAAERGDAADSMLTSAPLMGLDTVAAAVVELSGAVLGDAAEALNKLQTGFAGGDRLVVSCARLIRVDFSAAGSILNWVVTRESEGCNVQFRDVPCLVAVFFNVIGINEHARVVLRTH